MRPVKASSIIAVVLALATGLVQLSCQSSTRPSVLLIAVDDLSALDILCNEEMENSNKSGFEILCKESVRFTHAFTPSVLAVPTLASLLTGTYPFQHRVRNNGPSGLDPQLTTVAEAALEKNYRTAFFSGGPPVWRKSGLNQGFEIFDDNIVPTPQTLYRPFSTSVKSLLQWISQEVGPGAPFFAMAYAPDLMFTNTVTLNEFGEARNLSRESQLDELDSRLYQLFTELKISRRWNNTAVVVAGLKGHSGDDRPGELPPLSLHSDNTQVALFIKPPQKSRDEALQWKVDRNVSLVDLGHSLFEFLGISKNPNQPVKVFPVFSLYRSIQQNQMDWPESRLILIESDWAQWRGYSNRRSAVLRNHTLFLYEREPLFYNTLTDRLEMNPLRASELSEEDRLEILRALDAVEAEPWVGLEKDLLNKYGPEFQRWLRPDQKTLLLRDLLAKTTTKKPDPDTLRWAALLAFENKDWAALKVLGQKSEQGFWQYIAEKNGATGVRTTFNLYQDACLRLIEVPTISSPDLKKCDDPLFLSFINWQRAGLLGLSKDTQKRRFERAYLNFLIDQNIKQGNLATTLTWDTSPRSVLGPERTDLLLSLPEFQKQRASLIRVLQNSRPESEEDY